MHGTPAVDSYGDRQLVIALALVGMHVKPELAAGEVRRQDHGHGHPEAVVDIVTGLLTATIARRSVDGVGRLCATTRHGRVECAAVGSLADPGGAGAWECYGDARVRRDDGEVRIIAMAVRVARVEEADRDSAPGVRSVHIGHWDV